PAYLDGYPNAGKVPLLVESAPWLLTLAASSSSNRPRPCTAATRCSVPSSSKGYPRPTSLPASASAPPLSSPWFATSVPNSAPAPPPPSRSARTSRPRPPASRRRCPPDARCAATTRGSSSSCPCWLGLVSTGWCSRRVTPRRLGCPPSAPC